MKTSLGFLPPLLFLKLELRFLCLEPQNNREREKHEEHISLPDAETKTQRSRVALLGPVLESSVHLAWLPPYPSTRGPSP